MKKLLSILIALSFALCLTAQEDATETYVSSIAYPNGYASIYVPSVDTGTIEYAVTNNVAFIKLDATSAASDTAGTALTLDITSIKTNVNPGAIIYFSYKSGTVARNLTLGDNCKAVTLTGVASKSMIATLVYDGTSYILTTWQQAD